MSLVNDQKIRDAINQCYSGLKGDGTRADRIIEASRRKGSEKQSFLRLNKRRIMTGVAVALMLVTVTALAVVLMNHRVTVSQYGIWRYENGELLYQGESDARPQTVLADPNITHIATDDSSNTLYYLTTVDGETWLRSIFEYGGEATPGRRINRKYHIHALRVHDSQAYLLADTAQGTGVIWHLDVFSDELVTDEAVRVEGWENRQISSFDVRDGMLYAWSGERQELAVIHLADRTLNSRPIPVNGLLAMTAGYEKNGDLYVFALTRRESSGELRLAAVNTRTGEKLDTEEAVPSWSADLSRNQTSLIIVGGEPGQEASYRISTLSGKHVLHELTVVNGLDGPVMQRAVEMFNERYPDVDIVFRRIDDERVVATELMADESGIDIFGTLSDGSTPGALLLKNGAVLDLTDYPEIQDNWASWRDVRELVSHDGRQFGVLEGLDLYTWLTDERLAAEIGWEIPQGAWSIAEFESLVERVIVWNETHDTHLYLLCDSKEPYLLRQYTASHLHFGTGRADFETEEFIHLLNLLRRMAEHDLILWEQDLAGSMMFNSSQLPANTLLRVIRAPLGAMEDRTCILPPTLDGDERPYLIQGRWLYASANSRHPEETVYFLACYASAEATAQEWYGNTGQLLADRSLYLNDIGYGGMIRDDNEARYNAALALARPAIRISVAWAESTELLQAMLDGSLTPQEYAEIVQYQAEMMMGE